MNRSTFAIVALAIVGMAMFAVTIQAQEAPEDLLGLNPDRLRALLGSKVVSLVTSSYTQDDPAADTDLAVVTVGTGKRGYLLGYRVAGTVQGYGDVYLDDARNYNSAFFGDYSDTGWIFPPNWSSLTATSATSIAVRNPAQLTGTYSATILVGEVDQ